MIPMFLKIRIAEKNNNKKKINLWIPIILVWLIVFPLLIILAPFVLAAVLISSWVFEYRKMIIFLYFMIFKLIAQLSGLIVDFETKESHVFISIN